MTACIVGWAHTPFGKLTGETVESLGLTGDEQYDVEGVADMLAKNLAGGREVTVQVKPANGAAKTCGQTSSSDPGEPAACHSASASSEISTSPCRTAPLAAGL